MLAIQTPNTRRIIGFASLALGATAVIARPYLPGLLVLALTAACFALFAVWLPNYWRQIGEVARDGQKTAWLWGGSLAGGVAMALAILPPTFPLVRSIVDGIDTPLSAVNLAFIAGAFWLFIAQMAGFLLYWAIWWIAKR